MSKKAKLIEGQQEFRDSRRKFIRNTSLAVGAFTIVPRHVLGQGYTAPSDKINLGFIGLGKQGSLLAPTFISQAQAQIVAGSDVWTPKRKMFERQVEKLYAQKRNVAAYKGVTTYLEYKELLTRKDIDAVVISTPDHWHALQSIDAMRSGKDVYCEKPLTNTITEGIEMVRAVKQTKCIFQTGSMQRSWDRFQRAKQIAASGKLGEIKKVLVNVGDPGKKYDLPVQKLPKGIDWNKWCGPAPLLTYHKSIAPAHNKTYPDWRHFEEIGGGILSDWGAHMFDIAQWCLNMDATGPVKIIPPDDPKAVRGIKMYYANGVEMVHEDFGRGWGVRFIGSEGSMDISREYLETTPATILQDVEKIKLPKIENHYQDWLMAIRNRTQTICDVEVGHRSATICNIANIGYDLGRPLEWDPKKEEFKSDEEANAMKTRKNRKYE